jgi:hypothetical protein
VNSGFAILYDLRAEEAWRKAHRDRAFWEVNYTDIYFLDDNRIVLFFRPASDPRWRAWEEVRRSWILGEEAAA